jgi:hypothetical protein
MIEATQKQFWDIIGPKDVVPTIINQHPPYVTEYRLRNGRLQGRVEQTKNGNRYYTRGTL